MGVHNKTLLEKYPFECYSLLYCADAVICLICDTNSSFGIGDLMKLNEFLFDLEHLLDLT